jgi:hypothetical protein
MARTFIRQATQIRRSEAYTDSLGAGNTLEQGSVSIEDDLNGLRSQIKRILDGSGTGRWYDDLSQYGGQGLGLAQVNTHVATLQTEVTGIQDRKILSRVQVLNDIAVPGGQNYVLLTTANEEAPSLPIAFDNDNGAVAAAAAGPVAHSLAVTAGPNAISPKNLVVVRDAADGQPLQSEERDVYGLLQVGGTAAEGDAFDDADNQARISFVRINADYDGLEAVPAADIGGKTINYAYVSRGDFRNIPEDAFLSSGIFTDLTAEVDVTLNRALANHTDVNADVTANLNFAFGTNSALFSLKNSDDEMKLAVNLGGGETTASFDFAGGRFTVDSTDSNFTHGLVTDSAGTAISLGVTPGVIGTTGADLGIRGGTQLRLDDAARAGSTWATDGIQLSDASADWNNFATQFGQTSILGAIYKAAVQGSRGVKTYATVTANVPADTDIGGVGGGPNLDAQLPDLSGGTFTQDYDVFVNGELLRPGGNAGADHDYYPGTALANGQLKMEFALRVGDVICIVPSTKAGVA